ncbi:MAG: hypothetical protein IT461_01635 [Planctomycetes bacterium]|nr:hypothetical protein [Planctomycetota bacterium]
MLTSMRLMVVCFMLACLASPLLAGIPSCTIEQAGAQVDPTNTASVDFTVTFSEDVTGFNTTGVDVSSSTAPGAAVASVTPVSASIYTVTVNGMTGSGLVVATVLANSATSVLTPPDMNTASTSTDNQVTYDNVAPTVAVTLAVGQNDPTNNPNINFRVLFSENVTGFDATDVSTASSTATGTLVVTVTGGPADYNVQVTGATGSGNVQIDVATSAANDTAGNPSSAPTNTDNIVAFDNVAPDVTINQGGGQSDPTTVSPISFDVSFTESVTGFGAGGVAISGTAGGTLVANVSGSGTTYTVTISGMTTSGTVIVAINASAAQDAAGNDNNASTSTDNTVQWNETPVAPVLGAPTWPSVTVAGSDPSFTAAITVGQNLNVSFPATDANSTNTLTTNVSVTGGTLTAAAAGFTGFSGASFSDPSPGVSPHSITLAGSAASAGTITLQIQVSDGTLTDTYDLAITITLGNVAPVLGTPTWPSVTVAGSDPNFTASIALAQNLNVTFPATDGNTGDTLTTTVTVTGGSLTAAAAGFTGFSGATFSDPAPGTTPHSVTLAGSAAASGTINLQVQVSDGTVTDTYTLVITIAAATPTVTVTSPNGAENLSVGAMVNITWTNGGGFSGNVDIDLSTNGGSSFTISVASNIANTGSFAWTVPNNPSTTCRIRVQANSGGTPSDSSNANFTIAVVTPATITLLSPNGGETRVINSGALITWTNGGGFTSNVDILLSTDSGSSYPNTVASNIANNGFFNWTVPNLPTANARIRVRATGSGSPSDDSNADFTIVAGTLGGAVGHAGGVDVARTVTPGKKADGLHFFIANDAQSPAAFTVTSISVSIATNDNSSNLAISHLAGVRLQNGSGTNLETVLNSGTGWSVAGSVVTVTFGSTTPLTIGIPLGESRDFYVELFFTSVSITGIPSPAYACRIDNSGGTALNGGGTSNYPGVVAGGSITLVSSVPGTDDEDDADNGTCSLASSVNLWPAALLLAMATWFALRRTRRAVR